MMSHTYEKLRKATTMSDLSVFVISIILFYIAFLPGLQLTIRETLREGKALAHPIPALPASRAIFSC